MNQHRLRRDVSRAVVPTPPSNRTCGEHDIQLIEPLTAHTLEHNSGSETASHVWPLRL